MKHRLVFSFEHSLEINKILKPDQLCGHHLQFTDKNTSDNLPNKSKTFSRRICISISVYVPEQKIMFKSFPLINLMPKSNQIITFIIRIYISTKYTASSPITTIVCSQSFSKAKFEIKRDSLNIPKVSNRFSREKSISAKGNNVLTLTCILVPPVTNHSIQCLHFFNYKINATLSYCCRPKAFTDSNINCSDYS